MTPQFVRVSDGDCAEIIRTCDLIKIFKSEGKVGLAIIYEFRRISGDTPSQWREEYPSTKQRDEAFDKLVKVLCY